MKLTHNLFIALMAITTIAAQDTPIIKKQTPSMIEPSHNSTIDALNRDIAFLQSRVDKWNTAYIILLTVSIVVAALTLFAQFKTIRLARDLSDKQSALDAAKDRQLTADLSQRDSRIAELKAASDRSEADLETAKARIKEGEAEIAKAHAESSDAVARVKTAEARVAEAQKEAAEASLKAEGFRLDIANANARAAEANRIAEQERLARLQLEAKLADRVFTQSQKDRITSGLRSIGERTVDITIFGDTPEINKFSRGLLECFSNAGWSVNISRPAGGGSYAQGVLIGVKPGSPPEYALASNLIINTLRETVGGGVGQWEYDKLIGGGVFSAVTAVGKPTPSGESPLRIVIGSK